MEWVKLGDVTCIAMGKTPSRSNYDYWDGDNTWVSISDLKEKYICDSKEKITENAVKESNIKLVPKNTVIMSFKLSIGKVAITKIPLYTNEAIAHFLPKEDIIPEYLYYALQSIDYNQYVDKAVKGKTLNLKKLNNIKIPICNLEEQKYYSKLFNCVENLIQTRQDQIQALDDLVECVYNITLNENNNLVKLKDYVKVNPAKSEVKDLDSNTVISFVPMEDISENGELNLSKTKTIEEAYKGFTYFKDDDVVVAKITPCFENGKGALMKNLVNGIGFGTTEFHVLRSKNKNIINPVWLNYLTRTRYFRELGEIRMSGSAGQKRIGKDFVENFEFNLPPIEKQNLFAAFVEKIEGEKEILNRSLEELRDLFDSLMQDAFDGSMVK